MNEPLSTFRWAAFNPLSKIVNAILSVIVQFQHFVPPRLCPVVKIFHIGNIFEGTSHAAELMMEEP
jgi:hypothetical protein